MVSFFHRIQTNANAMNFVFVLSIIAVHSDKKQKLASSGSSSVLHRRVNRCTKSCNPRGRQSWFTPKPLTDPSLPSLQKQKRPWRGQQVLLHPPSTSSRHAQWIPDTTVCRKPGFRSVYGLILGVNVCKYAIHGVS